MKVQWFTTAPNPRGLRSAHRGRNPDDGQRGWMQHAFEADDKETFSSIGRRRAACGLIPAHGWSIDLFIEQKCARCVAAIARAERPHAR